jgi:hypothetical protein
VSWLSSSRLLRVSVVALGTEAGGGHALFDILNSTGSKNLAAPAVKREAEEDWSY